MIFKPEGQPERACRSPERYDLSTGLSYGQKESCHHIFMQSYPARKTLEYSSSEVKVVASIITHLKHKSNAQSFNLRKGLRKFEAKGVQVAKKELTQMRETVVFRAIVVAELTRRERLQAQEGLILLIQKTLGNARVG